MRQKPHDPVAFLRVVRSALPCLHFQVAQATSDRWRMESASAYAGPYVLPHEATAWSRLRYRLLNGLLWRQHCWNREAARVLSSVEPQGRDTAGIPSAEKPLLLVVVPSDASTAWSGGSARIWGLCKGLSRDFRVQCITVVGSAREWSRRCIARDFDLFTCPIPRALRNTILPRRRQLGNAAFLLTIGDPSLPFPLFDGWVRKRAPEAAAVLMVGPYLFDRFRAYAPNLPLCYDMHDINSLFLGKMAGAQRDEAMPFFAEMETRMVEDTRFVACVSQSDEIALQELFPCTRGKTAVVPNGIDAARAIRYLPSESRKIGMEHGLERPVVLFLGTVLEANRDAVRFIHDHLAPAFPDALWVVVGSAGSAYLKGKKRRAIPENMVLTGPVSEAEKETIFALSQMAIAPMAEGTGSSLKIPDYVAHGKLVLSTPTGLRGFEALSGHVEVAPLGEFQNAVRSCLALLQNDLPAVDRRAEDAWRIVRDEFDWSVISQHLKQCISPRWERHGKDRA